MKQFCLTLLLFIISSIARPQIVNIPAFGTNQTLEIATWNIENFPISGQNTIDYVTQIIQALDVDIFSFQEISDTISFKQMVNNLPGYQYYCKSLWYGGLAYIYKTNVIQINDFYEIYTTEPYWSPFPRSPLVIDMNYLGKRFFIINNHLKCCGDGILNLSDPGDEETRRYVASNLLKDYIEFNLADKNVLVVGDLNDEIAEEEPNNVFINILNNSQNLMFADMLIAQGNSEEWSYPTWPSHLDHILITNELFQVFQHQDSKIETLMIDQCLTNGWYEYETYISDHRPVAFKLKIEDNLIVDNSITDDLFHLIPNPANNLINVQFNEPMDESRIEIFNISGQMVNSSAGTPIDISHLKNGFYFVKLGSKMQKLIKN